MISENKYNDLEKYINQEMNEIEQSAFQEELKNNKELQQYLDVYQELPQLLGNIRKEDRFEKQLQNAKHSYLKQDKKGTSRRVWVIGGIILLLMLSYIVWKLLPAESEQNAEPELIFAQAFENTASPTLEFQRNNQTKTTGQELFESAFDNYQKNNFTVSINTLDSITTQMDEYPSALELKGYIQYLQKDYTNSINTFNEYLALENVERDRVIWYQTFSYFYNNQSIEAQQNLELIIDRKYPQASKAQELLDALVTDKK